MSMSRLRTIAAAAAVTATAGGALALGVGASNAENATTGGSGRTLTASLVGANEVPGPGSPVGSGKATFTLNPGRGEICFKLEWEGIGTVRGAHIHDADAGTAGPIVVGFPVPATGDSITGCQAISRELAVEIIEDPAGYYANFHTADFRLGAVRGQLSK